MMKDPTIIEERNLSVAWGKAFLRVLREGEVSPLVVVVRDIGDEEPDELDEIRVGIDELLQRDGKQLSLSYRG